MPPSSIDPGIAYSLVDQVQNLRSTESPTPPQGTQASQPSASLRSQAGSLKSLSKTSGQSHHTQSSDGSAATGPPYRQQPARSFSEQDLPAPGPAAISQEVKQTPKQRLDAYLASGKSTKPSGPTDSQTRPKPARTGSSLRHDSAQSASIPSANMGSSSRPTAVLRDPSIDSAISSNSSNISAPAAASSTGSHQTSGIPANLTPPTDADITSMIASCGTAETAVKRLLTDKHSLKSQNAKLWGILEKQRSHIMVLQNDWRSVSQELELYKKPTDRSNSTIPVTSDGKTLDDQPQQRQDTHTEEKIPGSRGASVDELTVGTLSRPSVEIQGEQGNKLQSVEARPSVEERVLPERRQPQAVPSALHLREGSGSFATTSSSATKSPQSATSTTSPMGSPGTAGGRKKAPPTPLNIGQVPSPSTRAKPDIRVSADDDQDGRGRRRTREDDDREREASFAEEERRSRSKKKSKSNSQPPIGDEDVAVPVVIPEEPSSSLANGVGLPSSPRAPMLGGLQSPPFQPSLGSIAGMMGSRPSPEPTQQISRTPSLGALKSPGLPMSPRPGDRPPIAAPPRTTVQHTLEAPLMSPGPLSARGGMLSPRPPRQPIPMPAGFGAVDRTAPRPELHTRQSSSMTEKNRSTHAYGSSKDTVSSSETIGPVYHGFMNDEYPDLLLPPDSLGRVFISINSSRMRPSRSSLEAGRTSEDDHVVTLAVNSRTDQKQLWRLEKTVQDLTRLDQSLRRSTLVHARLPDKSLFTGHAPTRVDQRRAALQDYFSSLLVSQYSESAALTFCTFLSSDAIPPELSMESGTARPSFEHRLRKEGYLAKKGKAMGGWKARYFVLDGRDLQYYEAPGAEYVGSIRLQKAQIGPQIPEPSGEDSEYRHAFMILEQKKEESSNLVRHILCAESDDERDEWINALRFYVEGIQVPTSPGPAQGSSKAGQNGPKKLTKAPPPGISPVQPRAPDQLQTVGYDQTIAAEAPTIVSANDSNGTGSPMDSESWTPTGLPPGERPAISGPVAGGPIQNISAWGNKSPPPTRERRNMFGFKHRSSEDNPTSQLRTPGPGQQTFRPMAARPVFGLPLAEAVTVCPSSDMNICLPSPVYRCIEYLEVKNAVRLEGLFRVSGSQTVIQALKQKFNAEGDFSIVAEKPEYEVMAVADLLRLYCRELPEPVLTRELTVDFYKILEVKALKDKVAAFNILVHRLPEPNFELLATVSRYLVSVVDNAAENRMHERNLATIWSSSFNIPFPLMVLFITSHDAIFGDALDEASSPVIQSLNDSPSDSSNMSMGDLRSPRKQMFTDLATPAPNQSSFGADAGPGRNEYHVPDTGSTPSPPSTSSSAPQQTYRSFQPIQPPGADQGFGSLNAALAPSPGGQSARNDSPKDPRKNKRESGVRNLTISPPMSPGLHDKRKSSMSRLREMAGLREER